MRIDHHSLGTLLAALLGLSANGCGDSGDEPQGQEPATLDETAGLPPPETSSMPSPGTEQPTAGGGTTPSTTNAPPESPTPVPDASDPDGNEPGAGVPPVTDPTDGMSSGPGDDSSAMNMEPAAPGAMQGGDPPPIVPTPDDPAEPAMPGDADMPGGMPEVPDAEPPEEMEMPDDGAGSDEMFGPDIDGACTESQAANSNASGSGPYDVVVETNSDPGINEGTIFRPADLGADELFPIFVWGEGGCSQNGLSNAAAMAEIASHGYFVVADGTPNGSGSRMMNSNDVPSMGEPLLAYIDWALEQNAKPCSAYYHALDASKIAANGFSCGGLMSTGTAGDPRMTTWGSTSSGTFSADQALYASVHTPVLIVEGGPSDIAYENGLRDYDSISQLGHPIMFFSKDIGHGGDLFQGGDGDFTKINLAWLNWWLKDDESASGKGALVGASCSYCSDSEWEVMSANLP